MAKSKNDDKKTPAPIEPPTARRAVHAPVPEPKPEMRNEDRRSPPNRHVQVTRAADRPAAQHDGTRSEVTGKPIVSRDVGPRGPDDLTGGLVTESRQTGERVTNEQRAGAMPESSRMADEEERAAADEHDEHKTE